MKTNGGAPVSYGLKGKFAKLRQSISLLAVVVLVLFSNIGLVRAAVFAVDRLDDDAAATGCDDATPNDCSLRGAVGRANAAPDHDVIELPAGTYVLSVPAPCRFEARGGGSFFVPTVALCLNSDADIVGAGTNASIIQGDGVDRVIAISVGKTVSIVRITVTRGGNRPFGFQIGGGGGILNHGALALADSTITANAGGNGGGGGIYNFGTLTLLRTLITGNSSSGAGGGVLNSGDAGSGTLSVQNSTISANTTGQQGGGLINLYGGLVSISGSTVSGNTASFDGGGIFNGSFSVLTATNSTVSGNQSDNGAGIGNDQKATVQLSNVTITGNTAGKPGSGRGLGGGLDNAGTLVLQNTIVAANIAYRFAPDCNNFVSRGHNLIQDPTGCAISGDATGNVIGQDPKLGLLLDNAGPTRTHALSEDSPAIDAGDPSSPGSGSTACASLDQRGLVRPLGGTCDIGAFERTGSFSLSGFSPSTGGNVGSVSTVVSGNGFAKGATIKLTRSGQPDIIGTSVGIDVGGSSALATFDLAGKPIGPWSVVITNPDGASQMLAEAFVIEPGRAAEVWVEAVGVLRRAPSPSRFTIFYGNRGNVDAVGVPLSIATFSDYGLRTAFAITSPPFQAQQVRTNWNMIPIDVQSSSQDSSTNVLLLLPLVPAGFTGMLQVVVTLTPASQEGALFISVDSPYFSPSLNPNIVSNIVEGARTYMLQSYNIAIPGTLVPELEQYTRNQLQLVADHGREALTASLGTTPQVYSLSQLQLDVAIFGARRALTSGASLAQPPRSDTWLATPQQLLTSLRLELSELRSDIAIVWAALTHTVASAHPFDIFTRLTSTFRVVTSFLSGLVISEAHAQQQNCPVVACRDKNGNVPSLSEGCSCTDDNEIRPPPPLPTPPGCDPTEVQRQLKSPLGVFDVLGNIPNCRITKDHCEALPDSQVIFFSDGSSVCAPKGCGKSYKTKSGSSVTPKCTALPIDPKRSADPNVKMGPLGVADARYRMDKSALNYVISFENLTSATAAAQVVVVVDQLDVDKVNLDTLSLGPMSFNDTTLGPASGMQKYTGGVDLRPQQDLIVTINATLDRNTGLLTWRFTSIDPATGQLTEDPDAGFLFPNVNPPQGEGSVVFTVEAKKGLASGTIVCNQASIVFDLNAPIATPQWCNTIDSLPPASQVAPLPATQSSLSFPVQWSGSDAGSGIADYAIFVSKDGGVFTPLFTDTLDTSAIFTGVGGSSYAFYSVARDLVGNVESKPQVAEASTRVTSGQSPPTISSYQVLFGSQSFTVPGGRTNLPWTAITGVKVTFSKPVTGNCSSLAGVSVTGCSGSGTNTLTWTFNALTRASYSTKILGTTANGVMDLAGNPLGGGIDVAQALNVLPGDISDDGNVASNDMVLVNNARTLPYNVIYDVNGDGVVDINDVNLVRARIGTHLP